MSNMLFLSDFSRPFDQFTLKAKLGKLSALFSAIELDTLLEHNRYLNFLGIAVVLGIAWLFSYNRIKIQFKLVFKALFVQFIILEKGASESCAEI